MRIDLKKLRYVTELLSDLYEPTKAMGLIRLLKQLQDDLGDLNDVWLARDIVTNLVDPDAPDTGIDHAGRRIIAWHTQRLAGNEPKLRRRLTQLLKSEPFWSAPPMLYVARNNPQSDPLGVTCMIEAACLNR